MKAVLEEYKAQLPLTVRQIFYVLVGRFNYAKTDNAYEALGEMLNLARRGGALPFGLIRDDGDNLAAPPLWDDDEEWLKAITREASRFRLSPWPDQPKYVEVVCEAGGMVPMLSRIADPYGVTVRSGGGFNSVTGKHDLARFLSQQEKPVVVLHVGDHDPSGVALWLNLKEDVGAFCEYFGAEFQARRVAVTPEQQQFYGLETDKAKPQDERNRKSIWVAGTPTVQAEALPPDVLQQLVEDAIRDEMDLEALEGTKERQEEIREDLTSRLELLLG